MHNEKDIYRWRKKKDQNEEILENSKEQHTGGVKGGFGGHPPPTFWTGALFFLIKSLHWTR